MKENSKKSAFDELRERLRQFGKAKLVTSSNEVMQEYRVIPELSFRRQTQIQSGLKFLPILFELMQIFLEENKDFSNCLPRKLTDLVYE